VWLLLSVVKELKKAMMHKGIYTLRRASVLLRRSNSLFNSAQVLNRTQQVALFSSLPDGVEELQMPALSPTMTVGTISSWLKKEGEELRPGDILCQIETDKAVVDYEMQDEAVLAHIVLPTGSADVPVGATLAYTVEDLDAYQALVESGGIKALQQGVSSVSAAAISEKKMETKVATAIPAPSSLDHRQPLIKFLGKRSLIEISNLAVSQTSTTTASLSTPAPSVSTSPSSVSEKSSSNVGYEDINLSNMRKIIAKRLTASKVTVPHHYSNIDCEIDNIMKLRQKFKTIHGVKVSVNDFILKAVALALRDVPEANCFFDTASKSIKENKSVDISVAVATATGLITPIVPKVDTLGLSGVNNVFMELVSRARENKLKPEEFQGGSFTVSNLGGFGIDNFTAVINPPQACIMAVGRGRKEILPPLEIIKDQDPEPRVATLMNVTLSSDRRVVDDVIAGQFLQVFKRYMENPELLSL
jgi:pyruvate dehydrogenase E2 component (dihydrolipoamide acetyltransferase)